MPTIEAQSNLASRFLDEVGDGSGNITGLSDQYMRAGFTEYEV